MAAVTKPPPKSPIRIGTWAVDSEVQRSARLLTQGHWAVVLTPAEESAGTFWARLKTAWGLTVEGLVGSSVWWPILVCS